MLTVNELRESFLQYFEEKGHKIVKSSSLVPKGDPTLLFTTAGMVQFKPMFAGTVDLDYTRATTVQKCLRTSDLENVGKTKRHCTFFEMLGNFSFGDYFKEDAIEFAWGYSTEVLGFPKEKLWATVYLDDDEAFEIWNKKIGMPADHIVRLGKEDNFWGPAGETGACGPCSELYIDRGDAYGCGDPNCKPGCDCERYMEFWNMVFNQFYQDQDGQQTLLKRTGIDTGMGLERLATIVQGVDSIYQTDELKSLVDFVCQEAGVKYEGDNQTAAHVIVEHVRSLTFAMSDGVYPSNDGRGYVLRRILRRGLRFSRQLGINEPFLYKLVDPIVNIYGKHYTELISSAENIKNVIIGEEKRFLETLDKGMTKLDELLKNESKKIKGHDAFVLYDTYGFPFEMTKEMAEEKGFSVDAVGFDAEMEEQRNRGKQSWKGADLTLDTLFKEFMATAGDTKFLGYNQNSCQSEILTLAVNTEKAEKITEGQEGYLVTKETVCYAESGGQLGDQGFIQTKDGDLFIIKDTTKINKTFIHFGVMEKGSLSVGTKIEIAFDQVERNLRKANHTATHLLQATLRQVLGDHVKQAGSYVAADRLRFDFSHFSPISAEELTKIEQIVNEQIWLGSPVSTEVMDLQEAVKTGAMAVFDEKYEDEVRVVSVGDFSKELCGGTHVANTAEIGALKILKESSPGAGLRRIEAITCRGMAERYDCLQTVVQQLEHTLNAREQELDKKVVDLQQKIIEQEKELKKLKSAGLAEQEQEIIEQALNCSGVKVIRQKFKDVEMNELREFSDKLRVKEQNSVVLFAIENNGKAMLMFAATKQAVAQGIDCGAIIKSAVKEIGGGGGGRKDMAQAGGKDLAGLDQALTVAVEIAKSQIK